MQLLWIRKQKALKLHNTFLHATNNGMLKQEIEPTHPEITALTHKAHVHILKKITLANGEMSQQVNITRFEIFRSAFSTRSLPHMSKITFVINLSAPLHSHSAISSTTAPPTNLNNNLISYGHTIYTSSPCCKDAFCERFLHTLE